MTAKVLPCVAMNAQTVGSARPVPGAGEIWCAIYVRISQDGEGSGLGVQRQEEDCRALAERKGWNVYHVYSDNDVSAFGSKLRKDWKQLLADIEAGKVNAIIGWHVDRLTRRPKELESLIDMAAEYRLQLATVAGDIDLGTAMGQLIARHMGAYARYESQQKGERVARQIKQTAASGNAPTRGNRCFGYNRDGTLNPPEATILREVVDGVLGGDSVYKWVNILNSRKVLTTKGNQWSQATLKKLLLNARLAGKRVHRDEIVADGDWDSIMSMNEHTKLSALLNNPKSRWPRHSAEGGRQRRYLLTGGIAKCGLCGKALQPKPADSGNRAYACRRTPPTYGCGKIRIAAEPLEDFIAVKVLGRLANKKIMSKLQAAVSKSEETGEALATEIGEVERQLRELGVDYYVKKEIGKIPFQAAQAALDDQLRSLRAQVVEAVRMEHLPELTTPEALAEWWENGSTVQERHDLVGTLIDEVRIEPSKRVGFRGLDEDRITIVWRTS